MAESKPQYYNIYSGGHKIGEGYFIPEVVKKMERAGYTLRLRGKWGLDKKKNATRKRRTIRRDTESIDKPRHTGRTKIHRANPGGLVKIYDKITRIEGTKGKNSLYPGQRFFHNFKRPYPAMYGTKDRKTLVIK